MPLLAATAAAAVVALALLIAAAADAVSASVAVAGMSALSIAKNMNEVKAIMIRMMAMQRKGVRKKEGIEERKKERKR